MDANRRNDPRLLENEYMQFQKEMFYYLFGVLICLVVIYVLVYHNARARMISKLPGPNRYFVVRNAWKCIRSPLELMKMARFVANIYDGICCVWICPFVAVFIYNPDDIKKIMSNIKYADKGFNYNFLKPWLRDGLLLSNGAKWQERGKILTPTFHFSILKQFFEVIEENSNDFVNNLKEAAGKPVDVLPIISDFTLNSICGQKFAMIEMKIAIAKVLREFDLMPVTRPEDIRFTADFILRHDGPILVNFVNRE